MEITKKVVGNTVELGLSGWMDTQSAPTLAEALSQLEPGVESLIFDMSGLEYTSSAGIRQIVAAYKQMKGALILRHVTSEVREVLRMTGLDKRLTIEP